MSDLDVSPYVDLTLYDTDPQKIFELGMSYMQFVFPTYNPLETHTEVALMEAMALMVNEAVFAINRVPGAVVEVLLRLFNIIRDDGHPPTINKVSGGVRFTMVNNAGYTIPAGTEVAYTISAGTDPMIFTTDSDLIIDPGDTFGDVNATGNRNSAAFNNVLSGTSLVLVSSVPYVNTVVTTTFITDGAEAETSFDFFNRGVAALSRLTDTLVLPSHFTAFALEDDRVTKAFTADLYDPGGIGVPGDNPGHVTVAVYGFGAPLSSGAKTAIATAMTAKALASLAIHVVDPTITAINVTATVHLVTGVDSVAVLAAVTDAVTSYLTTENWDWGGTVRVYELVSLIDDVAGVDYVATLTVPASNVVLSGVANLTSPGTITITAV